MSSILPSPSATGSQRPSQCPAKKPIRPEKLPKARELYERVLQEQGRIDSFEQRLQEIPSQSTITHEHDGHFLNVPVSPLRPRSRSTGSRSSRGSAASSASDINEDLTRMTSTFAIDGSSGYREHHRNQLRPYERAKAHLVRYLEACPKCRQKKVQCSLDHHDLSSLMPAPEPDLEHNLKVEPTEPPRPNFETPSLRLEIPQHESVDPRAEVFEYDYSPRNSLNFVGSAPEFLQELGASYAPQLDLPQSALEPGPAPSFMANGQGPPPNLMPYQDETFSNEHVINEFIVGQRQTISQPGMVTHTYMCYYPNCMLSFLNADQCINHYGTQHFQFNPISPPLRLVCAAGHFCRRYNQFELCFCQNNQPMKVFIYGQHLNVFSNNDQPSSAISNGSYNSSPNSGGYSNYPQHSWPSNNQYNSHYEGNQFGGSSGSGSGYDFSSSCATHQSCEYYPPYHTPHFISSPRTQTFHYYSQAKPANLKDQLKTKYEAKPRRFDIRPDHWIFAYQCYFQAMSIVSLTLSALFFGFGEDDLFVKKIIAVAGFFRRLGNARRWVGYAAALFCCFAVYRFIRHLWVKRGSSGDRHSSTTARCTLFKATIPLTKMASESMSKVANPHTMRDSFC